MRPAAPLRSEVPAQEIQRAGDRLASATCVSPTVEGVLTLGMVHQLEWNVPRQGYGNEPIDARQKYRPVLASPHDQHRRGRGFRPRGPGGGGPRKKRGARG